MHVVITIVAARGRKPVDCRMLKPRGHLVIDAGAEKALSAGKSRLPVAWCRWKASSIVAMP